MLKQYRYKGKDIQTITIPKGTALFRGIQYGDNKNKYSIFSDLIGSGKCIPPTYQSFFYPAPYVSESITSYKIHAIFVTNYDLELLLFIKPAKLHRGYAKYKSKPNDIITQCTRIATTDKCGGLLSDADPHDRYVVRDRLQQIPLLEDPCLTIEAIKRFPQIAGFIAIAEGDSTQFFTQHTRLMSHDRKTEMRQMMPAISSNSRGLISVPEIVIHPLHFRRTDKYKIKDNISYPNEIVNYCISKRAQFNYFPLLYIYKDGVFTFSELGSQRTLDILAKAEAPLGPIRNEIFVMMKQIMNELLSPVGYAIDGIQYRITIDMRTGYYIFDHLPESKTAAADMIISHNSIDYKVPFEFPLNKKEMMIELLAYGDTISEQDMEKYLNDRGLSLKPEYIFTKGDRYRRLFHVDEVFNSAPIKPKESPIHFNYLGDLSFNNNINVDAYINKYINKNKISKTHKNNGNKKRRNTIN
jgi:hypothetical protein